ncbi:MAG TPA: hybrid sensor histidine kinase/response regulator [Chloroflexia bacterium]|nr:hybrid sensor histidine kinase/response regulator [Chloroflexia bacterium]
MPARDLSAVPVAEEPGPGGDRAIPPARILVVDDNEDNLALLVAMLQTHGYQAETAGTGRDALAAIATAPPSLVLLDVMLPDLDGHEVARRIKQDPALPFTPIILVTARSDPRDKIYGLEQGADDFLSKPVNRAELLARVQALLRLKQAQDDLLRQHDTLLALHNQLRESEATRENLVQMITHDLRGPLTGLLGALELIEDGSLGPVTAEQRHFLYQSLQNCDTLNAMVSDLLNVYQLEAGRASLERQIVSLRPLADRACDQVQGAITGKKLTLENAIAADLPAAWVDESLLRRVLVNLLHNAFKYTDRGLIRVSATCSLDNGYDQAGLSIRQPPVPGQTYLTVAVEDTGVGISDETRAVIFQKFYRVPHEDAGRAIRGTGLGLYFCQCVVEAYGGNIWVAPRPDGRTGSVFLFSVPVAAPAPENP